ncbi:MAG: carboxypeptidase-like regulatory domain-containing protein, partial [Rhodothermales bacterium]
MNYLKLSCGLLLVAALLAPGAWAQETASISGMVTDANDGAPLAGANVVLRAEGSTGIAGGAATDLDGRYRIDGIAPGSYTLDVRFVGYQEQQQTLTLTAGETLEVDAALEPGGFDLN